MQSRRLWARAIGVDRRVVVEAVDVDESDDSIVVSCRLRANAKLRCGMCQRRSGRYDHGEGRRRWRALDAGTTRVFIEADAPRVRCRDHGVTVAWVPWARYGAGHTRDFDRAVGDPGARPGAPLGVEHATPHRPDDRAKQLKNSSAVPTWSGSIPDDASVIRLIRAVFLEQHDDWAIAGRRYLSEESMAAIAHNPEEITTTNNTALPAAQRQLRSQRAQTYFHHSTGHGPGGPIPLAGDSLRFPLTTDIPKRRWLGATVNRPPAPPCSG